MIDYEAKIFTRVYNKVSSMCADGMCIGKPVPVKAKLPAVGLYEMDNATVRNRQSSTPVENFALITYNLEIYAGTKKSAKKILNAADQEMLSMNFVRISGQYIPNLDNPDVIRYVARYEAVIDPDGNMYRA